MTPAEVSSLSGDADALAIWQDIRRFAEGLDGTTFRPQKTQISLDVTHPYAAVWHPAAALHRKGPPLVLTVFSTDRLDGPWTEVSEPRPHRFSHHAALWSPQDFGPTLQHALHKAHATA